MSPISGSLCTLATAISRHLVEMASAALLHHNNLCCGLSMFDAVEVIPVHTPTPATAASYRTVSISVLKPISCVSKRQAFFRRPTYVDPPAETQDARKLPLNNGYTSKVRVLDRYEVVGFISSGTYGRVYKAVGVKGQSGEFAIKKCVHFHMASPNRA